MKRFLATCTLFVIAVASAGCASNRSTVMDWNAFPPGRYGLYERSSGQLVLVHDLKAGSTFGFEYLETAGGSRSTAITIERSTGTADSGASRIWRLPVNPGDYEWRPLPEGTPTADVPSVVVQTRL
jgi:hypothetical protein